MPSPPGFSSSSSGAEPLTGLVAAVSRSPIHSLSKTSCDSILLIAGLGVSDDAHQGTTVKHRSRVARDPSQPNLRQVHLIHSELHDELRERGFAIDPGRMGENITTVGLSLLALPASTRLHIGSAAVVEITGLRNPCHQLDQLQPGLMKATLDHDARGNLIRKAGVMGIVVHGGEVRPRDRIELELPPTPHRALGPV